MADPALATEQAVARAVLEKGTPPTGASADVQAGGRIRAQLEKNAPRSVIEAMKTPAGPVDKRTVDRKLDSAFGTEIDPATGKKNRPATSPEKARFDSATESGRLINKFLEGGYDNLTGPEKTTIETQVTRALGNWPEAQRLFNAMTTAEKQAFIEDMFNNPAMAGVVRGIFSETLKREVPDNVTEAKDKWDDAKARLSAIQNQETATFTEWTHIDSALDDFRVMGGIVGPKLLNLRNLQGLVPSMNMQKDAESEKLEQIEAAAKSAFAQLEALRKKDPKDSVNIDAANTVYLDLLKKANDSKKNIAYWQAQIDQKTQLESELKDLQRQFAELNKRRAELSQQRDAAKREEISAHTDYSSASLDREADEIDFEQQLGNVFTQAALSEFRKRVENAERARDEVAKVEGQDEVSRAKRGFNEQFSRRWYRNRTGFRGRQSVEVSRPQVEADYVRLLRSGPDEIVRSMLISGGMNATEADEQMRDEVFMKDARGRVGEKVIREYMKNRRMTNDEAEKLMETDWGTEAMNKALAKSEEVKGLIGKLQEQGLVRGPDEFMKKVRENKGKLILGGLTLAGLILLILFNPAAGMVAAGATAEAAKLAAGAPAAVALGEKAALFTNLATVFKGTGVAAMSAAAGAAAIGTAAGGVKSRVENA